MRIRSDGGGYAVTKQLPNIMTSLRISCSLCMIFCKVFSGAFMILYIAAGITDMPDGFFAGRFHAESSFGEGYNSAAEEAVDELRKITTEVIAL